MHKNTNFSLWTKSFIFSKDFYFSPSKLSKKGTKALLSTLSSSFFQWTNQTTLKRSLKKKHESPNSPWTKRTKAPTTTLPIHNARVYGQLTSHEHNKGSIYWLKTTLSFAIGLKSKLFPMLPPKKKTNLRRNPSIPHNTSWEGVYPYFLKNRGT